MYKNQLQELAQRSRFNLPSYTRIREGPDHAPWFKAIVNFNGATYESPNYCRTLRQAEQSAAEVALIALASRRPSSSLAATRAFDYLQESDKPNRVRSFPHVKGNYALHIYIPVHVPAESRNELGHVLRKVASLVPGLHVVGVDIPLTMLIKDDQKLRQVALGREFHISLGRTVAIRVHQIDSIVGMLRQKLQFQKPYFIDFSKWEVFVNDDQTRSFLSVEITARGLAEITRQIQVVDEVYKLHNLPEFYKDPRPHISIAWALGDISQLLKRVVNEEMKKCSNFGGSSKRCMFSCKFNGIVCKAGQKTYNICKFQEER